MVTMISTEELATLMPIHPVNFPLLEDAYEWHEWNDNVRAHLIVHQLKSHIETSQPPPSSDGPAWWRDDAKAKRFIIDACSVDVQTEINIRTSLTAKDAYDKLKASFIDRAEELRAQNLNYLFHGLLGLTPKSSVSPQHFVQRFKSVHARLAMDKDMALSDKQANQLFLKAVEGSHKTWALYAMAAVDEGLMSTIDELTESFLDTECLTDERAA